MTRRRWIALTLAVVVLAALFMFTGSWGRLRGWVRGESFWRGQPTSYWREVIIDWNRVQAKTPVQSWVDKAKEFFHIPFSDPRDVHPYHDFQRCDATAVPVLRALLADEEKLVRVAAVNATGSIGGSAIDAVGELRTLLDDPSPEVRVHAALALWQVSKRAELSIPVLLKCLDEAKAEIRCEAGFVLSFIGPPAKSAVPALCDRLNDPDFQARASYIHAIGSMGPDAVQAVPSLIRVLTTKTGESTSQMEAAGNWQAEQFRLQVATALEKIGPRAAAAVPALTEALAEPYLCVQAALALHAIEPGSQTGVQALAELLLRASADPRLAYHGINAARALAVLGADAQTAVPALVDALQNTNRSVSVAAAEALWAITHQANLVLPFLRTCLRDPNIGKRALDYEQLTLALLAQLGPQAQDAVPDLVGFIERDMFGAAARGDANRSQLYMILDESTRRQAARALGAIGPAAREAIPTLVAMSHDKRPAVRNAAIEALSRIDPSFRPPQLRKFDPLESALALATLLAVFAVLIWVIERFKRRQATEVASQEEGRKSQVTQRLGRVHFPDLEERYLAALTQDAETASTLGRRLELLVVDYVERGQFADADSLYHRAIAIRDSSFRDSLPEIADALHALGKWVLDQGRTDDGKELWRRAVATWERESDTASDTEPSATLPPALGDVSVAPSNPSANPNS